MVGDADDHRVFQFSLFFQFRHQAGKQVVHQLGFQVSAVGFLVAGEALKFRVFFQAPVAEHLIIFVAQMGRTGNDEIQPFPFPEEFAVQSLVVKQQLVVVQQLLCSI